MAKQIDGKRILVTGGAAGIGAALVDGYVAEGAHVATVDLGFENVTDTNGVIKRRLDVTDKAAVVKVFDEVVQRLGGLDVIVNVAGVERGGPEAERSSTSAHDPALSESHNRPPTRRARPRCMPGPARSPRNGHRTISA